MQIVSSLFFKLYLDSAFSLHIDDSNLKIRGFVDEIEWW